MKRTEALRETGYVKKALLLCALIVMAFPFISAEMPEATVHAQSNCYLNCQDAYSACLRNDPSPMGCEIAYDNCIEGCV